jgi:hypothetical protein
VPFGSSFDNCGLWKRSPTALLGVKGVHSIVALWHDRICEIDLVFIPRRLRDHPKVTNILSRQLHEIPWISAADRRGLRIQETIREVTHKILLHVGRELPSLR